MWPANQAALGAPPSHIRIAPVGSDAEPFSALTFPRYRPILLGTEQPEFMHERIAVGAWLNDKPVGLAFYGKPWACEQSEDAADAPTADGGDGKPAQDQRQLLSVMVVGAARRQGLGARLLAYGEALARTSGTIRLTAMHSSRLLAQPAFAALLKSCGWAAPKAFEFRLASRASWALKARTDWASFMARLDARGYSATDWRGLNDTDRSEIKRLVEHVIPESDREFDPFGPKNMIEAVPELSLLLRKHGQIVGWILGSRGALPATFHYSCGYVLPEVQRLGWLVAGVRDVCQRQAELHGGHTLSVFETSHANAGMRRFMERHLEPSSEWTDARYLSEKLLPGGPESCAGCASPANGM